MLFTTKALRALRHTKERLPGPAIKVCTCYKPLVILSDLSASVVKINFICPERQNFSKHKTDQ